MRKGGTVATSTVSPNDPVWVEFARSMAPFLGMVAGVLAPMVATPGRAQKVLDVAAGHGLFGLRVAQVNPSATVYGTDWADVLQVAVENASALGVADRYRTIPGSAFDVELGTGYDLVLVPNFLHHFDCTTSTCVNTGLLAKAASCDDARRHDRDRRVRAQRGSRLAADRGIVQPADAWSDRRRRGVHLQRSGRDACRGWILEPALTGVGAHAADIGDGAAS